MAAAPRPVPAAFLIAILGLGAAVTTDVVPGVFSVDDNNYLINVLALREGRVTVPQTDGLRPSPELLFFDPGPWTRTVTSTPVASTAPPLYAPIALPFSLFGWRGLVALNTIAYLATAVMVFVFVNRRSSAELTPWLAAAAFALGGFGIEYAEGLWPHSLSVALCTAGLLAAVRAGEAGAARWAGVAGFLIALAAGVRYQNALILAAAALWLAIRFPRRKTLAAFVLAAALPLAASSTINQARHGSWNPISKGRGYLTVPVPGGGDRSITEPVVMFWSRLVDYSTRPPLTSRAFAEWLKYDPQTGAHIMPGGVIKKAMLQSAPWAVLGFAMLVLAWGRAAWTSRAIRPPLLLFSLVTAAVLGAFAFSGAGRDDGWSYNQRYLLELVPIAAIAFAWSVDEAGLRWRPIGVGAIGGAALLAATLMAPDTGVRFVGLMKVPLVLAASTAAIWALFRTGHLSSRRSVLSGAIGLCLGWALALHLAQDLQASHRAKRYHLAQTAALSPVLTDGSALVAYWGHKDSATPLLFDRDLVILDARADEGKDAPLLIGDLLNRGRRVFVLEDGFPPDVLRQVVGGFQFQPVRHGSLRLLALPASDR